MITKVFNSTNYETKDNALIVYHKPKNYYGDFISKVYYLEDNEKSKIVYETEKIVLDELFKNTKKGEKYIDIYLKESNSSLLEFINEIDELNLSKVWENSSKWFGNQIDLDIVDAYYKSSLRTCKKKYGLFLRLSINPENVEIENQFGSEIDLDDIPINSKVKLNIKFEGIKFYNTLFTPIYKIVNIKYYQKSKVKNSQEFSGSLNNFSFNTDYQTDLEINDNFLEDEIESEKLVSELIKNNLNNNEDSTLDLEQKNENSDDEILTNNENKDIIDNTIINNINELINDEKNRESEEDNLVNEFSDEENKIYYNDNKKDFNNNESEEENEIENNESEEENEIENIHESLLNSENDISGVEQFNENINENFEDILTKNLSNILKNNKKNLKKKKIVILTSKKKRTMRQNKLN